MANRNPLRETDWGRLLRPEFAKRYWTDLQKYVETQRSSCRVYPPADKVFRALELTLCDETKVVIVGQDPYHGAGQADGLCFSEPRGVRRPPSLVKIHQELHDDLGMPTPDHGSLEPWAHRGVLLLNTWLTVRGGKPRSHRGKGWEMFTDEVIRVVSKKSDPVFLLWGKVAQKKKAHIEGSPGHVIETSHPSPFSAHLGFLGSGPFSQANQALVASGRDEIDWNLAR